MRCLGRGVSSWKGDCAFGQSDKDILCPPVSTVDLTADLDHRISDLHITATRPDPGLFRLAWNHLQSADILTLFESCTCLLGGDISGFFMWNESASFVCHEAKVSAFIKSREATSWAVEELTRTHSEGTRIRASCFRYVKQSNCNKQDALSLQCPSPVSRESYNMMWHIESRGDFGIVWSLHSHYNRPQQCWRCVGP